MNYGNEALQLRYEAHDQSGYDPCLQLLILRQGKGVFYRTEQTRCDADGPDHFLFLSDGAAEAVRQILSDEGLYRLESLERVNANWGPAHTYDFFFSSEERQAAFFAYALEYIVGQADCPKVNYLYDLLNRLGRVLIPEGVPAVCFAPARRVLDEPLSSPATRVVRTFSVYDFEKEAGVRLIGDPKFGKRLERYAFERRGDGRFALAFQAGWPGGTGHWDGAGNSFALPKEWFAEDWPAFLDQLTARFPEEKYGLSREELAAFPGLKEFLGFADGPASL